MPYNSPGILEVENEYRYFDCPGSRFVSLTVIEQPIDINFGTYNGNGGPTAATYAINDQTLFPGSNPIPQGCDCIRYRNHTRGVSGRLTIAARLASDLPTEVELSASYVPSYYRITPEGRVEAVFEGHIKALGLDLPNAEFVENPNGNNQITWRTPEGVIENLIYGFENPITRNSRGLILGTGHNSEGTIKSGIEILETNKEEREAFLNARAFFVLLNRLALQRTWLDQAQRSSYLQWANAGAGAVTELQTQIFKSGIRRVAVGTTETNIRLPFSWPARQYHATVSFEPTGFPTIRLLQTLIIGRTEVSAVIENGSGATREMEFGVMSIGV